MKSSLCLGFVLIFLMGCSDSSQAPKAEHKSSTVPAGETGKTVPAKRNKILDEINEENTVGVNPRFDNERSPDLNSDSLEDRRRYASASAEEQAIVGYAVKFRAAKEKYSAMEYDLKYKTVSAELNIKKQALEKYKQQEYMPIAETYYSLLSAYSDKNGDAAARDLGVRYEFLDLTIPLLKLLGKR